MAKRGKPKVLKKVAARSAKRKKPELLQNEWRDEMEKQAKTVKKKITVRGKTVTVPVKVYPPSDRDVGASPLSGYGNRNNWRPST